MDRQGTRTEGILHLTLHHMIFAGEGEDEIWVSPTLSSHFPVSPFNREVSLGLNYHRQAHHAHICTLYGILCAPFRGARWSELEC
jgi:hypothetical protein